MKKLLSLKNKVHKNIIMMTIVIVIWTFKMIQGIWNKNHNKIQIKKLKFANILTKINAKREMIVILFIKKILRMEI